MENVLLLWLYIMNDYQKFILSGFNIFLIQSALFTNKNEENYDVDMPYDLYIDGQRSNIN